MKSKLPRVLREYHFKGELISRTVLDIGIPPVKGNSIPSLCLRYYTKKIPVRSLEVVKDTASLEQLVEDMSTEEKIHWTSLPYGVREAIKELPGGNPRDYVTNDDLGVYILGLDNVSSMSDLYHNDHVAWNLVKKRELSKEIFPNYKRNKK